MEIAIWTETLIYIYIQTENWKDKKKREHHKDLESLSWRPKITPRATPLLYTISEI